MPSPVGHAIAGLAVAWGADLVPRNGAPRAASWRPGRAGNALAVACAGLAVAPDLDLLVSGFHRSATHSLVSVIVVGLVAALLAARKGLPVARVALICAAAWGSHIPLDWVSADQSTPNGLQILWPFDDRWFISGWDVFPGTERRSLLSEATMRRNAQALVRELALMTPIVLAIWLVRVKALAGLPSELARSDHPPE